MILLTDQSPEVQDWGGVCAHSGQPLTDQALAILVHELRSPLAAIRNSLNALRQIGTTDRVADQAVGVMERQVGHMERLSRDLLDFTAVTAGKVEFHAEWLSLDAVFANAVETCRPLVEQGGQQLIVSLPPQPVHLRADPVRLQQILVNLLTNAAKYTHAGGHIWLTAEGSAGVLVMRVRDDGPGIAPDLLPRVFDLFQQGTGSGGCGRSGLGIGLALVKWLVFLLGGSVTAYSDGPSTGSEFVLRLPGAYALTANKSLLPLDPPHRHCPRAERVR